MIKDYKTRKILSLKDDTIEYLENIMKVQHLKTLSQAVELALAVDNPFDLIDDDFKKSVIN